ncbi:MAG: chloride channel protein [Xenococcaceae cyanobacterium]
MLKAIFKNVRDSIKSRHLARGSVDKRYALVEACIIGVFSALAALCLKQGISWLGGWRIHATAQFGAWLTLPIMGLVMGMLAGWAIEQISPEAAGSGIPHVKAVLARFPIRLSGRVAIVKAIATILVLGAGLTLGRRGPTVHIGAALAAQLSNWLPTSPDHRRQMIAAGAAAGLAAGFNTPIAGVLFVIEELMRDVSGLTLETAIIASFTGSIVSRILGSADLNIPGTMLGAARESSFSVSEIPFYVVLGICAGIAGAIFNRSIVFSLKVHRHFNLPMHWKIGLAGLLSGLIVAFLPPFFRDNAGLREFLLAGEADWRTIALAFVAHFFLTVLAYSSGAPGGLFAPALVMGYALGYLVGTSEMVIAGGDSSATFALAGMGAFFTGVVRVPVTAIVIVFEMTADFNLVLPLMIGCAISYIVGESVFSGSIYQHLLEAAGIKLKEDTPNQDFLTKIKAADVMQSKVETLESDLSLQDTIEFMSRSRHRGFPVVENDKLIGIVTQSDLAKLTDKSDRIALKAIMTLRPITVDADASLTDVLYLLNRYQLSRLPVLENERLVGIITRTDIIKAEVNQISGQQAEIKPQPSYVVYQTRSPATGRGRILLPISNPQNAPSLLRIAAAIARQYNYELECLQIIIVPKHTAPSRAKINTANHRKLMHRLERLGRNLNTPVHAQIKFAQDITEAILETVQQRHINLVLMGWKGNTSTPGYIFGNVVDSLIQRTPCDLVLVKLGQDLHSYPNDLNRDAKWLIPTAGGANAQKAMELLPALISLYNSDRTAKIRLCQVYSSTRPKADLSSLYKTVTLLTEKLGFPVIPIKILSNAVADAIVAQVERDESDVVILGASSEGLLQQAVRGNIPEAIARRVSSTVIIVRRTGDKD